jgi:NADPH:quinone reductase-like Zn-dependent oxidoreductase
MEILTLSGTGTVGMLLVQIAELLRSRLAQRVIVRALPRPAVASHRSAGPIPLK